MNDGVIVGKIINAEGHAFEGIGVSLNHIGLLGSQIRKVEREAMYRTNNHGIFRISFGWEGYQIGEVMNEYGRNNLLPYQLNVFDEYDNATHLLTRIVGEYGRSDGVTHIYNPAAVLVTCVSFGRISQGISPPPPFDRMVEILNYWGEFRGINLPAFVQQGGFMNPSLDDYALNISLKSDLLLKK
jgi:hypothetical protein